ncbi:MAG TPA: oxygen-independent coproporphyrinogen III oxidase [Gemmatimonadales bacterium]
MTTQSFEVNERLLRRFDKPGPRYTSYPTAVEFHTGVGAAEYRDTLAEANACGDAAPLSLYMHLPFCEHRCLFCGCHVVITRHRDVAARYLDYIKREIDMVAALLPDRRSVVQLQWGGGTPTYFTPSQLSDLYTFVAQRFDLRPDAEIALEVDPRVTSAAHLARLSDLGFNRLSLGVQDLTPEVQSAITRDQSLEETQQLIEGARAVGFTEGVNVDLIYGLPKQQLDTFEENLRQVIALRPDRVAVYSFAYVPWIRGHQRKIDEAQLPSPELKLKLYLAAMEHFLAAGYEPIGMDHFALPDDELARAARERRLHRNFMGYTVQPASDMVAFGISGIGDVQHNYFQNEKKLSTYYDTLDAGELPVARGYRLDPDDRVRRYVITQLMCNFRIAKADVERRFALEFDGYFEQATTRLAEPLAAGFVELTDDAVTVTPSGRLFVRNICMAFDKYLDKPSTERPVFSRTV